VDVGDQPVEEVLVLRVVSAARRRRNRRMALLAALGLATVLAVAVPLAVTSERRPTTPTAHPAPVRGSVVPAAIRAEILTAARVRYAAVLESTGARQMHLEFGRLAVAADRATLEINLVCVPLCGRGEELTLRKRKGEWQVVGARTTWLS
jgi:hypothetical protein